MRIGTWNLAGRRGSAHESFLRDLDCEVLLLTEVSERFHLDGYEMRLTDAEMVRGRRWSAVPSRTVLVPLPDPHPATASARVGEWTICSSILPWRSCGDLDPWTGTRHADKTAAAVDDLLTAPRTSGLIWGGDWNHAMFGRPEYAGSIGGRDAIHRALETLGLTVPTAELPHRIDGLLSIDHIAVPNDADVVSAERHVAAAGRSHLSDHDAYTVTLARSGS